MLLVSLAAAGVLAWPAVAQSQSGTGGATVVNNYITNVTLNITNVYVQSSPSGSEYDFVNAPMFADPPSIVAYGTRDVKDIRRQSGEDVPFDESDFPPPPPEPETLRPTLDLVRLNFDAVIQGTLQDAIAYSEGADKRETLRRLSALRLDSVFVDTLREEATGSGIYTAQALFHEGKRSAPVEAKVIADFSDPHWHVTSIKLPGVADKPPPDKAAADKTPRVPPGEPAPAAPSEPPALDPKIAFRAAVYDYVRRGSASGRAFEINDSEKGVRWPGALRLIHSDRIKDLGDGRFEGDVEFVDLSQHHVFVLGFLVGNKGRTWRVEKTSLRSVDGQPRKA